MAPEERRPLQTWHLPQNKAVDVVRWLPNPAITCDRLLVAALWNPDTATTSIDLSALCQNEETMDEDWETASSPWLECQASWTQDSRLSTLESAPLRLEQALVAAGSVTGSVSFVVVDPLRPSSSSHQSHVCPGLHDGMVSGIDLQVNTQDCVSVGDDGKINLLRLEQAGLHPKCISDNKGVMPFSAVRWASQMEFVTAGMGSSLQWWDHRRPGGPVSQTPEKWACLGAANFVHSIDVHPSRKHLCVVGGSAGSVFAWDLRWQQEPIQLAGVSLGRKGQFVGASIVESEVWEVKYDLLIPAVGQDTNLGKVPPVMICSEDGVLAVLEGGMALELLAEPCAINTFDMDPEHGKDIICGLEHESILYLKRAW